MGGSQQDSRLLPLHGCAGPHPAVLKPSDVESSSPVSSLWFLELTHHRRFDASENHRVCANHRICAATHWSRGFAVNGLPIWSISPHIWCPHVGSDFRSTLLSAYASRHTALRLTWFFANCLLIGLYPPSVRACRAHQKKHPRFPGGVSRRL